MAYGFVQFLPQCWAHSRNPLHTSKWESPKRAGTAKRRCASQGCPPAPTAEPSSIFGKMQIPRPQLRPPPPGVTVFEDHPRICIFSRLMEGFLDTLIRRSFQRVETSLALSHWFLVDVVRALNELVNLSITWELVKG